MRRRLALTILASAAVVAPAATAQDPAPAPSSLRAASAAEGAPLRFVYVPARPSAAATLSWWTVSGTAETGDFQAVEGSVVRVDGESGDVEIAVPTVDGDAEEPDETMTLHLVEDDGAIQRELTATGTIVENGPFTVDVSGTQTITEGQGATFYVRLRRSLPHDVTVPLVIRPGSADASDLVARAAVVIPAGRRWARHIVAAARDTRVEGDEQLTIAAGETALTRPGRAGSLTIHDGPPPRPVDARATHCVVPLVRGLTLDRAIARLRLRHCVLAKVIRRRARGLAAGRVAKSSPPRGMVLRYGAPVTLVVSRRSRQATHRS